MNNDLKDSAPAEKTSEITDNGEVSDDSKYQEINSHHLNENRRDTKTIVWISSLISSIVSTTLTILISVFITKPISDIESKYHLSPIRELIELYFKDSYNEDRRRFNIPLSDEDNTIRGPLITTKPLDPKSILK